MIQTGLAILDNFDPESGDSATINQQIEDVNKVWDRLHRKLGEREESLKGILDLSSGYYQALEQLSEWLPEVTEQIDSLRPLSTQPDSIAKQKQEIRVCLFIITRVFNNF